MFKTMCLFVFQTVQKFGYRGVNWPSLTSSPYPWMHIFT
jgi:hypothetical protein